MRIDEDVERILEEILWRFPMTEEEAIFFINQVKLYLRNIEEILPGENITNIIALTQTILAKLNNSVRVNQGKRD